MYYFHSHPPISHGTSTVPVRLEEPTGNYVPKIISLKRKAKFIAVDDGGRFFYGAKGRKIVLGEMEKSAHQTMDILRT